MESTGDKVGDAHLQDGGDPLESDTLDAAILALKIPGEVPEDSQVERTTAPAAVHEGRTAAAAAAPASSGDGCSGDGGGDSASAVDSESTQVSRPTAFNAAAESTAADAHQDAAVKDEVVHDDTVAQEGQSVDVADEAGDADRANRAAAIKLEPPAASPVPADEADATKVLPAAEAAVPEEEADATKVLPAAEAAVQEDEAALMVDQEGSSPLQTSLPPPPLTPLPSQTPSTPPGLAGSPKVEKEPHSVVESKSLKKEAVGLGQTAKVVHPVIPLQGPGKYGVWQDRIVDGVAALRSYLQAHWKDDGRKLPMKNTSDINCFSGYPHTAAQYSRDMQEQNVLRWGYSETRVESLRANLPGYAAIERSVQEVLAKTFPDLASGLGLHNGHILRQFFAADGGSGFSEHIDHADDCPNTLLWLSVAIKLTDDPPGEVGGTWMNVKGFEPVRYGKESGSVVMFLSRRPHWSMRTPPEMLKVLKLVLFYKFTAPELLEQYKLVAPCDLDHTSPRPLSVLPSQEKVLRRSCSDSFDECKKMLKISWYPAPSLLQVRLNHELSECGGMWEKPIYGICAEVCVRCPIPALPSVLVHMSDVCVPCAEAARSIICGFYIDITRLPVVQLRAGPDFWTSTSS